MIILRNPAYITYTAVLIIVYEAHTADNMQLCALLTMACHRFAG
ncbi:MAG: hypothetical protein QM236_04470 [Bacillota bacterium]|jgi:hypothetical protein|nr:hypothetical protein [Bacillota bacterium]